MNAVYLLIKENRSLGGALFIIEGVFSTAESAMATVKGEWKYWEYETVEKGYWSLTDDHNYDYRIHKYEVQE